MTSKNCFVEGNRKNSVMISKDRVNYQELLENHRFFKNKIISSKGYHRRKQKQW